MLRRETAGDPQRMRDALAGLRRYQSAPRASAHPTPAVIARAGRARLIDHGAGTGPPVIVVPSLINPPSVLDLDPDRSLLRFLARAGLRPLLVDWGTPTPADAELDIAGHVETLLLPLIDAIAGPAALVGYCLGGTIAIAAAALRPPTALALIATPWRFDGFSDTAREGLTDVWQQVAASAAAMGLLPMEVLQTIFWQLDPARAVAKFEALGRRAPDDPAIPGFVRLEDWSNDGPPLTLAVARDLFEALFRDDASGAGRWRVGGRTIDPAQLACPILDVRSTSDRIVPATSAAGVGTALTLDLGHVGMMVGRHAPTALWAPLADWLLQHAS